MKFKIVFKDKNVFELDNKPYIFNSIIKATTQLREHFKSLNEAKLDYKQSDYKIVEIK